MASRTVKVLKIAYVDTDGVDTWGDRGDSVDVHTSDVERFDRLNVTGEEPVSKDKDEPTEAPKRRPGRPRKSDGPVRDD